MRYIQCPDVYIPQPSDYPVFLAGGITNCPIWAPVLVDLLRYENDKLVLINPRRLNWDATNPVVPDDQIEWEYNHLNQSRLVSFWFPCEALCPITLFELGSRAASGWDIVVGCHPDYARRIDVVKQLSLMRPQVKVVNSLYDLSEDIRSKFRIAKGIVDEV